MVNITWKINDMKRNTADGGVTTVYWSCTATDDTHSDCSAVEAGKLRMTPDASADGFIAYDDLVEETVLTWVQNSLDATDETSVNLQTKLTEKVAAQVAKKTETASGLPWAEAE